MSYHSPRTSQSQFQYDSSTPPPPPPKPSARSSGQATPPGGPPQPPPPPKENEQSWSNSGLSQSQTYGQAQYGQQGPHGIGITPPEAGWLPAVLKEKSYVLKRSIVKVRTLIDFVSAPRTYSVCCKTRPYNSLSFTSRKPHIHPLLIRALRFESFSLRTSNLPTPLERSRPAFSVSGRPHSRDSSLYERWKPNGGLSSHNRTPPYGTSVRQHCTSG